jgi:hypothetical protein
MSLMFRWPIPKSSGLHLADVTFQRLSQSPADFSQAGTVQGLGVTSQRITFSPQPTGEDVVVDQKRAGKMLLLPCYLCTQVDLGLYCCQPVLQLAHAIQGIFDKNSTDLAVTHLRQHIWTALQVLPALLCCNHLLTLLLMFLSLSLFICFRVCFL